MGHGGSEGERGAGGDRGIHGVGSHSTVLKNITRVLFMSMVLIHTQVTQGNSNTIRKQDCFAPPNWTCTGVMKVFWATSAEAHAGRRLILSFSVLYRPKFLRSCGEKGGRGERESRLSKAVLCTLRLFGHILVDGVRGGLCVIITKASKL